MLAKYSDIADAVEELFEVHIDGEYVQNTEAARRARLAILQVTGPRTVDMNEHNR